VAEPLKRLTAEHIKSFVEYFLQESFDETSAIPDCHMEWWEMCCSTHPQVAIAAPRGHAKSTAITYSYVLANICFRMKRFILIVSDTEEQAGRFVTDIVNELLENDNIRAVFGIRGPVKETATDAIIEFEDGYKCRIIAKGSEQKLRGMKWDNLRPDLVVCDDLENDEIVMNDDRRIKFRNWFYGALVPCKSIKGQIRIVGTILHMDSMLQRLMPPERSKENILTPLSIRGPFKNHWYSALYRAHDSDFSHILWRERMNKEWFTQLRNSYLADGQGDKYAQEMLNMPLDEANSYFRKSDLLPMTDKDFEKRKIYYVGCDLAFATEHSKKGDYTVFVVGGVDEDGVLNVVNIVRRRMDSVEAVDEILRLNKEYDPAYFFFEKGAMTNSVLPHLQVAMNEANNYATIELFARVVDKISFAQTIRARLRSKRVKVNKREDWYGDFEQEMLRFPRDVHDDQVDGIAILGRGVEKFIEAPTDRDVAEDEYEDEKQQSGMADAGRSEITGY
jgi:predicted phage terminase large subunit-like protein